MSEEEVPDDEETFPYEYHSDLHWLWSWGYHIRGMLNARDLEIAGASSEFRPSELAVVAMQKLGLKYDFQLRTLKDHLDFVEKRYGEVLDDPDPEMLSSFRRAARDLESIINKTAEIIANAEGVKVFKVAPESRIPTRNRARSSAVIQADKDLELPWGITIKPPRTLCRRNRGNGTFPRTIECKSWTAAIALLRANGVAVNFEELFSEDFLSANKTDEVMNCREVFRQTAQEVRNQLKRLGIDVVNSRGKPSHWYAKEM